MEIFITLTKYNTRYAVKKLPAASSDYIAYSRYILGICCVLHQTGEYDTRPFQGGSGCRTVAQTRPVVPKMVRALSGFPYNRVPQAPGDKPSSSDEG